MAEARGARLLTRPALRRYLGGLEWLEVEQRMNAGRLPRPMWGVPATDPAARWDVRAVDRALDAASGAPATVEAATSLLDQHFAARA